MFKKLWTTAMALWCAFIPFLSQVTVSGWNVSLEANELSSISTSMIDGASSMLNMTIQLVPTIVWVTVVLLVWWIIFWLIRKIRRRGK